MRAKHLTSLVGAFFLVIGLWTTITPLFAGPDEPASYVRGAAVVRGQFVGTDISASETTSLWSTYVEIPQQFGVAQLVPWCFVAKPEVPACTLPLETLTPVEEPRTDMGRYPPIGFVVSGVGSLIGPNDLSVRLGRILNALAASILLALGCVNVMASRRSLIIVLAAITPGVIFFGSVISSSSLEIASAICLWCAVTALQSNSDRPKVTVYSVAIAATILILARPVGAIIAALIFGLSVISGTNIRESILKIFRNWQIALAVTTSITFAIFWYFRIYSFHLHENAITVRKMPNFSQIFEQSLGDLSIKIGESIGNYGWLDTPTPTFVIWFFVALTFGVVAKNWDLSVAARKRAVVLTIISTPIFMIFLNHNYQSALRTYGVQGRHLTPLLVGVPIIAGAIWRPSKKTMRVVLCCWSIAVFVTATQVLRRYSVGLNPRNFFTMFNKPEWTPLFGVFGSLTMLIVALTVFVLVLYELEMATMGPS